MCKIIRRKMRLSEVISYRKMPVNQAHVLPTSTQSHY
jgi:hypothetical protein